MSGMAPSINCLALRAATTTNANLLSGAWLSTVMRSLSSTRFHNLTCALAQATAQPPRPQPPFQLFLRGRQNEDGHRVWQLLFYLFGALYVNFEHQVQLFALRLF